MAEQGEKFTGMDALLFGTPLWKSKDVIAWQQRGKLIESQEKFQLAARSSAEDIAGRIELNQISQEQARRELVDTLKTSIRGFVDEQRRLGSELVRNTEVTAHGFHAVVRGQELLGSTIIDSTREQTGQLVTSQQFQAGSLMGGGADQPIDVRDLGLSSDMIAKLVANGTFGCGTSAYAEIASSADPLTMKLLNGEISSTDLSKIRSKAYGLEGRIDELKTSSGKENAKKIIKRHNKAVAGMPGSYSKMSEISESTGPDPARSEMESQLRDLKTLLEREEAAKVQKKYARKSTVDLVREGEVPASVAEVLIRHQKLSTRDTDELLEARLVTGPLGSSRRMNVALDDQTRLQGAQLQVQQGQLQSLGTMIDQNERRERILASVELGIKGVLAASVEQSKLQADQLVHARRQTGLQQRLVELSQLQVELGEDQLRVQSDHLEVSRAHLMTTERTNELIEAMAEQVVERLDFSNKALAHLSQQLEGMTDVLAQGIQRICLTVQEGVQAISQEVALTRIAVSQSLEVVTRMVATGFTALDTRIAETNEKLGDLIRIEKTPRKTATLEACQDAIKLIGGGEFRAAIERLQEHKPDTNPQQVALFLLGYTYYKEKDYQASAHYLGRAKKYAENEKDVDIAEHATSLLAHIALQMEELSLSMEALQGLVDKKEMAPHLRSAHLELAALQFFSGHREHAIDYLINQIITNPLSLQHVLKTPFVKELMEPEEVKKWKAEITDINTANINFDPQYPYRPYCALSIFAALRLKSRDLALACLRVAIRKWKQKLLPLKKEKIEEELKLLSGNEAVSNMNSVVTLLSNEQEFYWLIK